MSVATALGGPWVIARSKPLHGLGNRVRAVLGSRALAHLEGRRFGYVWPTGRAFGARLDELWQIDDPAVPSALSGALALRFPYRGHDADRWVDEATRHERVWQIRTAHALLLPAGPEGPADWTAQLRSLRPAPVVTDLVNQVHRRHLAGRPYVAVMARAHRHSHEQTLAASPLAWFVERMREVRATHPQIGFFVSADTSEAVATLTQALPGCVAIPQRGTYNSRRALQVSVADLYLMASAVHVIGPHYSSFPELAQHLAGPALRLETSRTADDQRLEAGDLTLAPDPVLPHVRRPANL